MIRRATAADVPAYAKIINDAAEYGLMLHRSLAYLYERLPSFRVAEEDGEVVGVCGLSIVWASLAEVFALAVRADQRGKGLGGQLVEATLIDAHELGIRRVMALTYEQRFFERLGFTVVDRQKLPLKVWSECLACPKNQACDEIAMIKVFEDLPELEAPRPITPPPAAFIVPTIKRRAYHT